jgi:hypothetical protein
MDSLDKQPELRKTDVRFATWNVRSLYRVAGLLISAVKKISVYKLDFSGVQVRWDRGGTEPAGKRTFFYGKGNKNNELGTGFLCLREPYPQLRG